MSDLSQSEDAAIRAAFLAWFDRATAKPSFCDSRDFKEGWAAAREFYTSRSPEAVERLREALAFYADEKNYSDNGDPGKWVYNEPNPITGGGDYEWECDNGERARAALDAASEKEKL